MNAKEAAIAEGARLALQNLATPSHECECGCKNAEKVEHNRFYSARLDESFVDIPDAIAEGVFDAIRNCDIYNAVREGVDAAVTRYIAEHGMPSGGQS